MLNNTSEPDGEEIPKKGDSEFKEVLDEYVAAAIEPTLILDEHNNPIGSNELNGDIKKQIEGEEQEENTPLSDLIEDDEIYGLKTKAFGNGVKASMAIGEIDAAKKIAKKSVSQRIPLEEIKDKSYKEGSLEKMLAQRMKGKKDNSLEEYLIETIRNYGKDSPERTLLKEILEYDKNEMFSFSNSGADSMKASYGHSLLEAFGYLCKKRYDDMKEKIDDVVCHYKRRKEPKSQREEIQYLINELKGLMRKVKGEETTKQERKKYEKQVQEDYEEAKIVCDEVHKRKPGPESKRWKDKKRGRIISSEVTKEDEERIRKEAEAYEQLIKKTTNYDKK